MVNILVPTDFSNLSNVAVQYAIRIADNLGGNVTLLHIVTPATSMKATVQKQMKLSEHTLTEVAMEKMESLLKEVSKSVRSVLPVKYKVVKGTSFHNTIRREAKRLHTGLIIMGTKGAGGLKKVVMGSNTTSVIEVSHVPVLAVPAKADFTGFRNIIYASDLKNLEKELKILVPYVERFGSVIHLLHILPNGREVEATEEKIEKVLDKLKYKNIITLVLVDRNIESAIDQYIDVSKANLLAMFTHELSFYEKLFDRSYTRRMAFHSKVPLLAFKQAK